MISAAGNSGFQDACSKSIEPDRTVILLATYNGYEFLREQLRSLRDQTDVNWVLVVRDDHSTDATPEVLDAFARSCPPGQVVRVPSGEKRIGAVENFVTLLHKAPPGTRYAFCDQDDIWFPDKLARASRLLGGHDPNTPALYCARQTVVSRDLREIGLSPAALRRPSLRNALVQNIAVGCTVVMNWAARQAFLAVPPPPESFHDWWCYLVTTATGGHVIFDTSQVMHYRQHGSNVVGMPPDLRARVLSAAARGPAIFMQRVVAQAEELLKHPNLTSDARALLQNISSLRTASLIDKIKLCRRVGIYRQSRLEDAALYAWIVSWHFHLAFSKKVSVSTGPAHGKGERA